MAFAVLLLMISALFVTAYGEEVYDLKRHEPTFAFRNVIRVPCNKGYGRLSKNGPCRPEYRSVEGDSLKRLADKPTLAFRNCIQVPGRCPEGQGVAADGNCTPEWV